MLRLAMQKPTGVGIRAQKYTLALEAEGLIKEKVHLRVPDDTVDPNNVPISNTGDDPKSLSSDAQSEPEADSDIDTGAASEDDTIVPPAKKRSAKAVRTSSPGRRHGPRNSGGADFMRQVSQSLDPGVQRARDLERSERMSASTTMLVLHQQLRDQQKQMFEMQDRLNKSERQRDIAEMRLEMVMNGGEGAGRRGRQLEPGRRKHYHKNEVFYPEGGANVTWQTDGSETDPDDVSINSRRQPKRQRVSYDADPLRADTDYSQLHRGHGRSPFRPPHLEMPTPSRSVHPLSRAPLVASTDGLQVSVSPSRAPGASGISFTISPIRPLANELPYGY